MKKFTALFLALLMCMSLFSVGAFAATPESGVCEDGLSWSVDSEGTLTISGNGAIKDYLANLVIETNVRHATSAPWGKYYKDHRTDIVKIVLAEGVTGIGKTAFYGLDSVKEVVIPASLTTIASDAFMRCSGIEKFIVASGNTSFCDDNGIVFSKDKKTLVFYPTAREGAYEVPNTVTKIGDYAFYECSKLTGVTFPASLNSIGINAFAFCPGLTELVIPGSVTTVGAYAFFHCTDIASLTLSEGLKSIGDFAFCGSDYLKTVTIPKSVTAIGGFAFAGCKQLKEAKFLGHAPKEFGSTPFGSDTEAYERDFRLLLPANDSTWTKNKPPYLVWDRYDIEYYDAGIVNNPFSFITDLFNSIMNIFRNLFSWLPFFG